MLRLMDEGFTRIENRLDRIQESAVDIDARVRTCEENITRVKATCEERARYCPALGRIPDGMFSMQAGTTRPLPGAGMAQVASVLTPKAWAVIGTGFMAALVVVQLLERVVVGFLNHLGAGIK